MKLYKVLSLRGKPINGGSGVWSLPKGSKPGKWMPKVEKVEACKRGYHLCQANDLLSWISADEIAIWEAEGRGQKDDREDKTAFAEARLLKLVGTLNARTIRHFAADCAERVLPIFEKKHPKDDRPCRAIKAARDFADGKIDAAARAAAWNAAWDAARAAAWDAAGDAAWDAEKKWQLDRLFYYLKLSK